MQHLKPINLSGRPARRRSLKSLPSLSCDYPNYSYGIEVKPVDAQAVATPKETKKEKVAA